MRFQRNYFRGLSRKTHWTRTIRNTFSKCQSLQYFFTFLLKDWGTINFRRLFFFTAGQSEGVSTGDDHFSHSVDALRQNIIFFFFLSFFIFLKEELICRNVDDETNNRSRLRSTIHRLKGGGMLARARSCHELRCAAARAVYRESAGDREIKNTWQRPVTGRHGFTNACCVQRVHSAHCLINV